MTKPPKDDLASMLDQASADMMASDPIVRKAFSVGLLAAELFVPVYQTEDEQAAAGGISLQAVNIGDTTHVLLFSSVEKLGEFMDAGTRYACASGLDILTQIQHSFAVLNPGPDGRALTPADIAEILGNPEPTPHVHGPDCGHSH